MGVTPGETAGSSNNFSTGVNITGLTAGNAAIDLSSLAPSSPTIDKYGNLKFPSAGANAYWNITDNAGNVVMKVYVDGSRKIILDGGISITAADVGGNILDASAIGTSSPVMDRFGNIGFPNATSGDYWSIVDKNGNAAIKVFTDGTKQLSVYGDISNGGHYLSSGTPIIQCNYASVPTNGGGGYVWTFANSVPGGHNYQPSMTMNDVPGTQYFTSCGNNSTTKCTYYQSASSSMSCWMFMIIQRQ